MMFIYINVVLTTGSAALIIYALYLQAQMRKLHKVQVALGLLELHAAGNLLGWRNRALSAERELRQLKEKDR